VNSPEGTSIIGTPLASVISVGRDITVGVKLPVGVRVIVGVPFICVGSKVCDGTTDWDVKVYVAVTLSVTTGAIENHFSINGELKSPTITMPAKPIIATTIAVFGLRTGRFLFSCGFSTVVPTASVVSFSGIASLTFSSLDVFTKPDCH
jgi:hypothetical protein